VRWWNGERWSDLTTPAGPGVAVRTAAVLAPARPPELFDSGPEPRPAAGRPSPLVTLGILGLIVAVVVGLLIWRPGSDGLPTPSATGSFPSGSLPSGSAPSGSDPTFPPGTVRIVDDAAGISYPYLGQGWTEWRFGPQIETTEMGGQYFTTQEITPDHTTFIAQCTSGPLSDGFGWSGSASLQSTVKAVADTVQMAYYPQPNQRKVMRDEARTVDGHAAHLFEFQLSWNVPGYNSTGERAALLLIDVGRAAPALLYISIPNTHAELYGVIDRVLGAVDVL
jgi:hypothetical protein